MILLLDLFSIRYIKKEFISCYLEYKYMASANIKITSTINIFYTMLKEAVNLWETNISPR